MTDELVERLARAMAAANPRNVAKIALDDMVPLSRERYCKLARAALSAIEAEGYVVVPRKPTEEMLASCGNGECAKWAPGAWANYIAASPKP